MGKLWSKEEIKFVKTYYKDHTAEELAEGLEGRTVGAIRLKILELNLKKRENYIVSNTNNKICTKCKQEKPKSEFSLNRKRKDSVNSWCKACCNEQSMLYSQNKKIEKQKKIFEELKEKTGKEMKRCTKCGELKPGTDFYFIYSRKRRESECIECGLKRKLSSEVESIKNGTNW